ncbi:MAG: aldo/keto reductase [bacterium]
MQTRKLGYTDLNLSVVGLGAWAIGGGNYSYGWGPQDDEESIKTIRGAIDNGINWIDTAPVYGCGRSETVVGKAIKGIRDKVFIATKCGLVWNEKREIYGRLKKDSVRREVEDSLSRLGIDVIDLYQIHWPDPEKDIEEAWGTVTELVKEGKIRNIGVSNFTIEQIKRVQSINPLGSLQPPYSMVRREVEKELLGYCAENDIGVIVYSPLQSGILTGKFTPEKIKELPEDDWRLTKNTHFQEPLLTPNLKLVEGLREIAKEKGKTVAQIAIAWTLRRCEVTSAIVGARHPQQVIENVGAGELVIDEEDKTRIDGLLDEWEKALP